ncbi:protein HHL1, chloroplastic-like isoform X2 [Durio zibethinus]|uniref:Protein HHL1, chloroplastic-like isoform X2 n=1 Tax=Durio zibethinus TaxID=66656 RepID=A0A6P5XHB3_DURZI|nr:protein HHL1, chloroplastic-like isoform X2 [Durio zibethinus]
MEVGMSLNALVRLPLSTTSRTQHEAVNGLVKHSLFSSRTTTWQQLQQSRRRQQRGGMLVIEAKGKKGMAARRFQRPPPPPLPKIEEDGNPRFVIFIRMANDEKEIQKTAFKQFRVLRSATEFRYGYKLVENGNMRAALSTNNVIELPTQDQLKTVLDKVKDFFGDAKESFGKITELNSAKPEE